MCYAVLYDLMWYHKLDVENITCICVQLNNNGTSNSQLIARGKAECNFDCYYSLIALKYMWLAINYIELPMRLSPYP